MAIQTQSRAAARRRPAGGDKGREMAIDEGAKWKSISDTAPAGRWH